jgi:hypothetical protein
MQQMIFIADIIACSTCFGHHYAHHQGHDSIIQKVAACGIWCYGFQVVGMVWSSNRNNSKKKLKLVKTKECDISYIVLCISMVSSQLQYIKTEVNEDAIVCAVIT